MQTILNIYKPQGLTPLQTINLLREKYPEYKDTTIGFAGRLDPLAHGVLLLMVGEETTKDKDKYLNLPKEYEFEAVFGVATDTYDVLGLIQNSDIYSSSDQGESRSIRSRQARTISLKTDIQTFIKSKLGKQVQTYPPYSSKPVKGKPLYQWAREGKLSQIEIPEREIEIYEFHLLHTATISKDKLKKEIFRQIDLVDGDFRQKNIKETWDKFFDNYCHPEFISGSTLQKIPNQVRNDKVNTFQTAKFRIVCSSGTYVRSLVNQLGERTGLEAISLDILRTKVGTYSLKHSIQLI